MLRIMADMATRNDQRPRNRPLQALVPALEGGPCNIESVRTQWRSTGPNSQGGEPPQRQPVLCLSVWVGVSISLQQQNLLCPCPINPSSPSITPLFCQSHPLTQIQFPLATLPRVHNQTWVQLWNLNILQHRLNYIKLTSTYPPYLDLDFFRIWEWLVDDFIH